MFFEPADSVRLWWTSEVLKGGHPLRHEVPPLVKSQTFANDIAIAMFSIMAIQTKVFEIIPIQSNIGIIDIRRSQNYLVMNDITWFAASFT